MAYTAEISRRNPTCILFLIDRSGSMGEIMNPTNIRPKREPEVIDGKVYTHEAQGRTKAQFLADAINRLLQELIIRCSKGEEVRDYFHIGIIGYGAQVGPALGGPLAGRELVPISEIAFNPARVDERVRKVEDGAGGLVDEVVKFPIWFDPIYNGGTPMCQAFGLANKIVRSFVAEHPGAFPPVVFHLTDGESTDGDPTSLMQELTSLSTSDGNVLLFNFHISAVSGQSVAFPATVEALPPDPYAQMLFRTASELTPLMLETANSYYGMNLSRGARGFLFNADGALVIQGLDIGSRYWKDSSQLR